MRAIIDGPDDRGEGAYYLIREDGKTLASHLCSHAGYAEGDLFGNRPERKAMLEENNITEYVWLDKSGITRDELLARNKKYHEENPDNEANN